MSDWLLRLKRLLKRSQCDAVKEVSSGGFICCVKRKGHFGRHVDYSGRVMGGPFIFTDSNNEVKDDE